MLANLQVFGYLYPGYLCFKDVEAENNSKLKLWCMYWYVAIGNLHEPTLLVDRILKQW